MYLSTLLKGVGLDPKQCKIVKHSGERFEKVKKDEVLFRAYQSCQPKKTTKWNFSGCKYLIAFGGTGASHTATFIGCFEILGEPIKIDIKLMPNGYPFCEEYTNSDNVYYEMVKINNAEFDSLKDRLIIEWNGRDGVRTQNYPVKVISIQKPKDIFPGYDKYFMYDELKEILDPEKINNYPNWKTALDIYAIYLLTDIKTGKQYVGSATAQDGGLLNRWTHYITVGIDNDLTKTIPPERFRFSILEILNKREANMVLDKEYAWMDRLCSYVPLGYNNNPH